MVEVPWNPINEPIFLDLSNDFSCCILQLPSEPRNRSYFQIPLTHSDFDKMTPMRREQHAAGRFCLAQLIEKEGITGIISIKNQFPLTINTSIGMFPVSISHSNSLAIAVIGKESSQIGVDLEPKNRLIRNTILDQFCTQKEINLLSNESSNLLRLKTWMAKEAVSKATGKGMSSAKEITINTDIAHHQSNHYRLFHNEHDGHLIIVALSYSDSSVDR